MMPVLSRIVQQVWQPLPQVDMAAEGGMQSSTQQG